MDVQKAVCVICGLSYGGVVEHTVSSIVCCEIYELLLPRFHGLFRTAKCVLC